MNFDLSFAVLCLAAIVCALQAIRSKRLLRSALWLAGLSAVLSIIFYRLGAYQVAAIELSVGAGLVTVLFVFAISIAGDQGLEKTSLLPTPLALVLVLGSASLLTWISLPLNADIVPSMETDLTVVFWQERSLDVLVQVVLIFSGVLGLLGILAEVRAPLEQAAAAEVAAVRDKDLRAMEVQSSDVIERTYEATAD